LIKDIELEGKREIGKEGKGKKGKGKKGNREKVQHPLKWVSLVSGIGGTIARGLKHHA